MVDNHVQRKLRLIVQGLTMNFVDRLVDFPLHVQWGSKIFEETKITGVL